MIQREQKKCPMTQNSSWFVKVRVVVNTVLKKVRARRGSSERDGAVNDKVVAPVARVTEDWQVRCQCEQEGGFWGRLDLRTTLKFPVMTSGTVTSTRPERRSNPYASRTTRPMRNLV